MVAEVCPSEKSLSTRILGFGLAERFTAAEAVAK